MVLFANYVEIMIIFNPPATSAITNSFLHQHFVYFECDHMCSHLLPTVCESQLKTSVWPQIKAVSTSKANREPPGNLHLPTQLWSISSFVSVQALLILFLVPFHYVFLSLSLKTTRPEVGQRRALSAVCEYERSLRV